MLNAIIIEDEEDGRINLKNILNQNTPHVKIIAEGETIKDGLKLLSDTSKQPDVVFLDIKLADGLVFNLLDQLNEIQFEIIFVTAYEKFAMKACNYSSIGYVTKPIITKELVDAVMRVKSENKDSIEERYQIFKNQYYSPNPFHKISIPSHDKIVLVDLAEIMYMKGENNLTQFILNDERNIWCSRTLKEYEHFEAINFFRIHKNCIINLNYIKEYVRGEGYAIMADNSKQIVSRRNKPLLMKRLKEVGQLQMGHRV